MSRLFSIVAVSIGIWVPKVECFASTVFDDFSQFPFEERVDFSTVTEGNVDIVVRQDAGAFRRNVRLGTLVTTQPAGIPVGSAAVGVTGPERSEFFVHTDHFSESFRLSWTNWGEPFSLGSETTAIAFDFGDVSFADPIGEFRLLVDSQGVRRNVASRSFSDIASDSMWIINFSEISAPSLDPTSIKEIGITTQSVARGTSFSISQVRLIPEPCSPVLVVQAIVLTGLLSRIRKRNHRGLLL